MLDSMFTSVLGSTESVAANVTTGGFLLCSVASLVLGAACALIYMFRHKYSRNFVVTFALLPLVVQTVITLFNGNLGAGIAVMGVFNLVRFRSIPGKICIGKIVSIVCILCKIREYKSVDGILLRPSFCKVRKYICGHGFSASICLC